MNDVHFYLGASLTEFKNRWNSVCPIYVAVHTMALFKSDGTLEAKSEVFNITIETKRCKSGGWKERRLLVVWAFIKAVIVCFHWRWWPEDTEEQWCFVEGVGYATTTHLRGVKKRIGVGSHHISCDNYYSANAELVGGRKNTEVGLQKIALI